jgi:hypothetical protein
MVLMRIPWLHEERTVNSTCKPSPLHLRTELRTKLLKLA